MESTHKHCSKCNENKRNIDFYNSYSPLDSDGKVRVCKTCLKSMVNPDNIDSVKDVLRMVDKPFVFHLWESAITKNDKFGQYFKLINAKDYRHMNWDDSISELVENESNEVSYDDIIYKPNFKITNVVVDKWGYGYTIEEYQNFENKYDKLIKNYGEKTALHTEGLITYIRYRVKEEMSTAKGEVREAKEWGQLASKAATDAKINVSQLSKSDISGGIDVLSQLFEAVETEVGIIPLLPKVLEQPYDDADMIIWSVINYYRRLEDKSKVPYRDIYNFYDEMLGEHFNSKGYNEQQIIEQKEKRNNVFRDLEDVYKEPLYDGDE